MKFIITLIFFVFSQSLYAQIYPANSSLFKEASADTYNKSSQEIHKENLAHIQHFIDFDVDTDRDNANGYAKSIPWDVAYEINYVMMDHPVISMHWDTYIRYDPENKGIGFCFGRAMFANIELEYRQLDSDSIKKAFAIGPMTTGGETSWSWHVTTIAQSFDEQGNEFWIAIDPVTGVSTLREWYAEMFNDFSTDQKLKIYITEAGKFGPHPGSYDEDHLDNEFYNDYFVDMMDWFSDEYEEGRYDELLLPNLFLPN
jgi:hypothetical protein